MSRNIDMKDTKPTDAPRGDGSFTRHAFTLAILMALGLAGFAFYHMLGRSTDDVGSRLEIQTRPAAQVYAQAESIEVKTLRLRALRNFVSAYPNAEQAELAAQQIKEMETSEHQAWRDVSETFYSVTRSAKSKREALDGFKAQWDGGTYSEEALIMEGQLEAAAPAPRTMNEDTGAIAGLAGSDIRLPDRAEETESQELAMISDDLAGALPMAKTYPIAPPVEIIPTAPEPVVTEATVSKDRQPRYPSRARDRGVEASLTVSMDIGADGKVIDARVIKPASGKYAADFGRAAVRAAKRTRFNPKTIDGEPAPTNGYTRRYRFQIED